MCNRNNDKDSETPIDIEREIAELLAIAEDVFVENEDVLRRLAE
ncbi:hypothetical protein WNY37_06950 [Henriciella sp. AS95]